ncbi:amino acid permease-domain-containing protein [Tirmania nivea]|nr:amino acid permease-domain-containing protein [Tirmania nivea]
MFLRFGFILGQSGILGTLGVASYLVCLITTLSISAISSNGTVRGGGAYYLISRSLGPEFGGSIGLVFYMGCVFNTGLNAVGMVDCMVNNFGKESGTSHQVLPEDYWMKYLYSTAVLVLCTVICLMGSSIFSKASNFLLIGERFQDLFGILFPACSGIFAGASMSGDLRKPSKSIPKGTLHGLLWTFLAYTLVILAMGASITRDSMYNDLNIIQDTNISGPLILLGEFATSFFSVLMGVIGSAKSLQALARDDILPGFSFLGQGTKSNDEPIVAILVTFILSQLTLVCDINQIASFITMTYLMTFFATNLACFLLKISSAPNFRPSFKYFTAWTAFVGAVISCITMFFVDGVYATGCVGILGTLFLIVHYTTPPKSWGDVSQSLIYHQVRKYLLRLKQEHVKFWRPQILLFINDPRNSWELIQFCNALKKGGLYILGHIIVTSDFQDSFAEVKRQQAAWMKYIDFSKIKGFVQIAIAPTVEWGARNIVLSAGLGGMHPNIAVLGLYNLSEYRASRPLIDIPTLLPSQVESNAPSIKPGKKDRKGSIRPPDAGELPTDSCRPEKAVTPQSYVNILEDLLLSLQINVALAKGFKDLELPDQDDQQHGKAKKKFIDLWPIQMAAEIEGDGKDKAPGLLTTNFDTYTLILQLGCILHTVPSWKKYYSVRVIVFVEYESEVEEEQQRVAKLLENLRIQAEIIVTYLANGSLKSYETIVNGCPNEYPIVEEMLGKEDWWKELKQRRRRGNAPRNFTDISTLFGSTDNLSRMGNFQQGSTKGRWEVRLGNLGKFVNMKKRHTMGRLNRLGMPFSLTMRANRLRSEVLISDSELSDTEDEGEGSSEGGSESAVSEGDLSDYQERDQADESQIGELVRGVRLRRASTGDALGQVLRKNNSHRHTKAPSQSHTPAQKQTSNPTTPLLTPQPQHHQEPGKTQLQQLHLQPPAPQKPKRPEFIHRKSTPSFTSRPVPEPEISLSEEPGAPSIGFSSAAPSPAAAKPGTPAPAQGAKARRESKPKSGSHLAEPPTVVSEANTSSPAQAPARVTISFNDLPSKAQHLILNELMRQYSGHQTEEHVVGYGSIGRDSGTRGGGGRGGETAVMFTTLPAPMGGTWRSERESLEYLEGLELLTGGLPPTVLVHSNSLTVTTAL